jgi:hypothetical protein
MSETVSFVQIVTAVTQQGPLLYGLTTSGAVYEYNFSGEVWIPLPMRALPTGSPGVSVVGLRGPGVESEPGSVRRREWHWPKESALRLAEACGGPGEWLLAAAQASLGAAEGYVAQLEMGLRKNPSLAILKRFARTLGVPVAELLE